MQNCTSRFCFQNIDCELFLQEIHHIVFNAATSIESINAVKAQAIAAIAYAKAAYSSAFGPLGEKQNGPAIEVIKDGERIILYRPDRVNFIRANN